MPGSSGLEPAARWPVSDYESPGLGAGLFSAEIPKIAENSGNCRRFRELPKIENCQGMRPG